MPTCDVENMCESSSDANDACTDWGQGSDGTETEAVSDTAFRVSRCRVSDAPAAYSSSSSIIYQ